MGQDTGQGTDYMELSELADILSACPHLDFLLFDACFMSSVETAYELRRYTDFYVGSPTENPGPGAPYDIIMPYMFTPGAAAQMAQAYFEVYEGQIRRRHRHVQRQLDRRDLHLRHPLRRT